MDKVPAKISAQLPNPNLLSKSPLSKLFVNSAIDIRDDLEEKFERAHVQLLGYIHNLTSEKEYHDNLSALACKDNKAYDEICHGLLYQILTDPQNAPRSYRDLTLLSRDGLNLITTGLAILIAEKYQKFTELARRQALWALRELVRNQVLNVDNIVWNIMRHAAGGDISVRNLQLVEGLLDILIENRPWLEKHPFLVGAVVYTYVRLIEDHHVAMLSALKAKETKFVVNLIRDRFVDVIPLGRDFVRILQNVARIPEFEQLWRDMMYQPKTLLGTFTGIWQLLHTRTSRRFLQCRLTPEVERKVHFITNSVKFGFHKRYQDWFQERYFNTHESHTLRSDLIRFIVNVIHPTNDMLCSDIVPRWAIIGWLLTSCTSATALANAKLSLFYDWLVFDPVKDNIMNIEPGILVMWHSVRNHPLVSSTLLDFLCRIMRNFSANHEDRIRAGVYNSLRKIVDKQVIPSLLPLFESSKLDRELRATLREHFREFCTHTGEQPPIEHLSVVHQNVVPADDSRNVVSMHASYNMQVPQVHATNIQHNANQQKLISSVASSSVNEPCETMFSEDDDEDKLHISLQIKKNDETDDDDDIPLSKVRLKKRPCLESVELPSTLSTPFEKLVKTRSPHALETLLTELRMGNAATTMDEDQENYLVATVCDVMRTTLPIDSPFADSKSDEKALQNSIAYPLFSLFRFMYQFEDKLKKSVVQLLRSVFRKLDMPCGHLMLYFLKVNVKLQNRKTSNFSSSHTENGSNNADVSSVINSGLNGGFKTSVYQQLCEYLDDDLGVCLARDMAELEATSSPVFLWLLPDIMREFKSHMINNSSMLQVLCGCVDARGLRDLIYSVTQGKLTLFQNDGIIQVVRESLVYETFEQICLWQLLLAHDVPIECLQDLLPDLESSNHAEALTYMLLMLKNEKPTTELTRLLLSREAKHRGDQFVTSALRYWCQEYEEHLSEIIGNLLTSKYPHSSPNKRKRPLKSNVAQNSTPNADQLLSHLEHFRRSCRHGNGTGTGLYVQDSMQRALQQSFMHSNDSIKKQYCDLFALAAEDDTSGVGRRGTSGRGRKPTAKKSQDTSSGNIGNKKTIAVEPINNVMYSSDEESSEDDWSKPSRPTKRRRKAMSDSD